MNLNDELISQETIDGQLLYVLDPRAFELLIKNPVIEDKRISALDIVSNMMDIVKKHNLFSLTFYPLGKGGNWMFCLLLDLQEKQQRVQIENVQCIKCNWKGIIANPTIPELYYGSPDRWEALDEAYKVPKVHCPNCNNPLPRYSIWTNS
ncbi:hypothetical protein QW71_34310 [Paenibacillus sp. IHB B 3415]|uniref:hypothetical protein n=1 Tax=Paenibacillus sp. IHB B 3415 TaxID=867080 RepID=UPI0005752D71|nr:hypothetical protein [Paenibacillus sp. IHB B 3415]KHL91523.1 hypothetical protein QW71_34310 [Paenibacillus sp. IHB B 3415]